MLSGPTPARCTRYCIDDGSRRRLLHGVRAVQIRVSAPHIHAHGRVDRHSLVHVGRGVTPELTPRSLSDPRAPVYSALQGTPGTAGTPIERLVYWTICYAGRMSAPS